jgi:hypothetical protein
VTGPCHPRAACAALIAAALAAAAAPAAAQEMTHSRFAAVMDSVFGRGAWRMTGGYRTPEREDQLRAQGAMTVRPGGLSRHSLGRPGAPGAFDLVVDGLSPYEAARRLQAAGAPFARYQPKGAHGTQGPHLHLEPYGFGPLPGGVRFQTASLPRPAPAQEPDRPARAVTIVMPAASARSLASARQELSRLEAEAEQGGAAAQLELGRAYAFGYVARRDFTAALRWLDAATGNPGAAAAVRAEAAALADQVAALLDAERGEPARLAAIDTAGR